MDAEGHVTDNDTTALSGSVTLSKIKIGGGCLRTSAEEM